MGILFLELMEKNSGISLSTENERDLLKFFCRPCFTINNDLWIYYAVWGWGRGDKVISIHFMKL